MSEAMPFFSSWQIYWLKNVIVSKEIPSTLLPLVSLNVIRCMFIHSFNQKGSSLFVYDLG
jgi:hypothetical protein